MLEAGQGLVMVTVQPRRDLNRLCYTCLCLALSSCTLIVLTLGSAQPANAAHPRLDPMGAGGRRGALRDGSLPTMSVGPCLSSNYRAVGNIFMIIPNQAELVDITYPADSRAMFAYIGLLIGAVLDGDTLVTTGSNFGLGPMEYFPSVCGVIEKLSPTAKDLFNESDSDVDGALSDYDVYVRYADTLTDPQFIGTDPIDGRKHKPLGVEVSQSSFSWVSGPASHCVLIEYRITNINRVFRPQLGAAGGLKDVFVGLSAWIPASYAWADSSIRDNLVGYVSSATSPVRADFVESFNTVWMADNDGDPDQTGFGRTSMPDAVAVSILRSPSSHNDFTFNWWAGSPYYQTWGPVQRRSKVEFVGGELGRPQGDRAVYQMMANTEIDYPQLEAAINHEARGWLPPPNDPADASDIAAGAWVQFLLSAGPFDLPVDSTATFVIAIVGAPDFHMDPANFREFFDPLHPELYWNRLNLASLLSNVQWAKWTYDNPGVDTDSDGYAGEWYLKNGDSVYYRGDGVADLKAALPPRAPLAEFQCRVGQIAIHWNGRLTETLPDLFTQRPDFEGYRIYLSRTGRGDEWSFLAQRDLINYARYTWSTSHGRWEFKDPPFSLDSLRELYEALCDTAYGFPFHPDSFQVPLLERALLEVHLDSDHPEEIDSIYRYFTPYEANNSPDDLSLAMAADAGVDVTGVIRKLYPQSAPTEIAYRDDGTPYVPYYEYEYVLKDIQPAEPVFLSVTAFDNGDPASGLRPLELAKSVTAKEIWPINDADVVKSERPKPGVYPNPYRLADDYYGNNWEDRRGLEPDRERARQVTFYNVPDTCKVSIWTLDGDLVRNIHHSSAPSSPEATVVRWNLITRNTQAVKTGIYIWSIESRFGTDVGKLVIVK